MTSFRPCRRTWVRLTSTCSTSSTKASRSAYRPASDYRRELKDISNLYVVNKTARWCRSARCSDVRRVLGSELVTRYNLYPAATITGIPNAPLQLRPGDEHHGAVRPCRSCRWGMDDRMDRAFLPGEADRQPGLFHFRAVDHAGLPGAGRPVRELDRSGRRDSDRADGAGRNRYRAGSAAASRPTSTRKSDWC